MKQSIEPLLLITVAFLVFAASLPIGLAFSSDGDLEYYYELEDKGEELEEEKEDGDFCFELEKDDESKTSVTVFHQDEFGNDLLPACIISINDPGELYIAVSYNERLPEYNWTTTIGSTVGFHGEDDIEVIFICRRRPLLEITPDRIVAYPGDVIAYTIVITNEAAEAIEDTYTIQVYFDPTFSSVHQLEFILDHLAIGDNMIQFSMAVDQNALEGGKIVKAILEHPTAMIKVNDTEVMTEIEVTHPEVEEQILPRSPLRSQLPDSGTILPANEPPVNSSELNDSSDVEKEGGKQAEPTLTMIGTSIYDLSILGAIAVVNFKNWHKMGAIRL